MIKALLLCLALRTLYCAKGNYDFGISRVIKSLEPYNKKVSHLIVLWGFPEVPLNHRLQAVFSVMDRRS